MVNSNDNPEEHSLESSGKESVQPKFRFGTLHLFYLVALIASGFVVVGWWSLLISAFTLLLWLAVFQISIIGDQRYDWLAVILLIVVLTLSLLPTVQQVRSTPIWMSCSSNMRQLILALHNYEFSNKVLPPSARHDKDGNPMHSWRVRILPYVERQGLFDQYNFSEPWDGPNNSKLANQMPEVFHCPSTGIKTNTTIYKLVNDEKAFFNGDRKPRVDDCVDGTSSSLILVEDPQKPSQLDETRRHLS